MKAPPLAAILFCVSLAPMTTALAQAPEDGDVVPVSVDNDGGPSVEWFRDARFGLFVHWGISSQTGGQWHGENYYGITEWLWRRSEAPRDEYMKLLDTFNPKYFDAEEWVDLAVDAGTRYMVVTAKHHDGVAMYDTDASEFDVTNGSAFGRDPLRELADASAERGLKLGFYYSQYQDWAHPHGAGNAWEYDRERQDFSIYQREKALPQLDELLTNYGDVALIWFDTPGDSTKESAEFFVDFVRERQPETLISSRIGHGLGDYQNYRDSEIPVVHESSRPFEAIFPHNESWGYSALDTNFKSPRMLLHILVEVASKGGNFLLNVGPDGDGRVPKQSVDCLREVGAWLDVNGESIYGTSASPYAPVPWGAVTQRENRLYLHILHPPESGSIFLPTANVTPGSARLLASNARVGVRTVEGGLEVALPQELPDDRNSVVVIEHDGGLIKPVGIADRRVITISHDYSSGVLESEMAALKGNAVPKDRRYWLNFGEWKHFQSVEGLKTPEDAVSWSLLVLEPGTYGVVVHYSANADEAGQEAVVKVAGQERLFRVLETGDFEWDKPVATFEHPIGTVTFDEPGRYTLSLSPLQAGGELMKLRRVELVPHD